MLWRRVERLAQNPGVVAIGLGRGVACGAGGPIFTGGFDAGAAPVVVIACAALTARSGVAGGASTWDGPEAGAAATGAAAAEAVGVGGDSSEPLGAGDAAVVWLG